jgi:hypothetical protein
MQNEDVGHDTLTRPAEEPLRPGKVGTCDRRQVRFSASVAENLKEGFPGTENAVIATAAPATTTKQARPTPIRTRRLEGDNLSRRAGEDWLWSRGAGVLVVLVSEVPQARQNWSLVPESSPQLGQ